MPVRQINAEPEEERRTYIGTCHLLVCQEGDEALHQQLALDDECVYVLEKLQRYNFLYMYLHREISAVVTVLIDSW